MKFRIYLTANTELVPFSYPHKLCGIFHHWLGPNELHSMMSLYSLGWLQGKSKTDKNGLVFPQGTHWDIGIYHDDIAERLVRGLLLKEFVFYGMQIQKVNRLEPPEFDENPQRFLAASPILIRKKEADLTRKHVTYKDPESSSILNRVIHNKAREAGLPSAGELNLKFDDTFKNPKTKLIDIKGIKNRTSACPIIAEGKPEALEFLWVVGAGELTGTGFGSLVHTGPFRNGS